MPVIQPIKGIRPPRDKVQLVASRSVNTYSKRLLMAKMEENPYTFLHIILPEFGKKSTTKPNSTERYRLVKKKFGEFRKKGVLVQDDTECLYIYRQVRHGHAFTGIIAGASVEDYNTGKIKIHEQTLRKRQEIFTNYLDICEFNAEPVLLSYTENPAVEKVLARYTSARAEYEFTTSDTITHYLWIIDKKKDIDEVKKAFAKIDAVYIADGHHRSASSAGLASRIRSRNKKHQGNEMYNYCLSYFIPDTQMKILEFNRLVKDTGKLSAAQILEAVKESFNVQALDDKIAKPSRSGQMGMYMEGKWYLLSAKPGLKKGKNAAQQLDASILTEYILAPVFGIKDLTSDQRIDFAGGNMGPAFLQRKVDKGDARVAFYLYPVSFKELKAVADQHLIMPPKSTYILPKMRSGLVIQSLK